MTITLAHLKYLEWVSQGRVILKNARFIPGDWSNGHIEVNQTVAVHAHRMGLTHIVSLNGKNTVALTSHGLSVINDEREAWG